MRTYEALYIVRPDAKDDEIQTIAKDVEGMVTSSGGTIVRSEIWGKRRLAYEVERFTEGVYILLRFQSPASFVKKLAEYFRLSEQVIRDLIVYFDEKTLRLEEEQKRRAEAEIRASAAGRAERDEDDEEDDRRPRRGRDDDDDDDDRRPRRSRDSDDSE